MSGSLFDFLDEPSPTPPLDRVEVVDYPKARCPKCENEQDDLDGFGIVFCGVCGYCTHPSIDGEVCGLCGKQVVEVEPELAVAAPVEMPSAPLPLVEIPSVAEPALPIEPTGGQGLLGAMFSEEQLNDILSAQAFPRVDLDIQVDYRCPCCQYEWSGNPKPKLADQEADFAS